MLFYFMLIMLCQLLGELVVAFFGLSLPGPVVGMVLLFLFLVCKGAIPDALNRVSGALLNHLSLLFVPAGVGVMAHVDLIRKDIGPLTLAMLISTLAAIAVTALVMNKLHQNRPEHRCEGE